MSLEPHFPNLGSLQARFVVHLWPRQHARPRALAIGPPWSAPGFGLAASALQSPAAALRSQLRARADVGGP